MSKGKGATVVKPRVIKPRVVMEECEGCHIGVNKKGVLSLEDYRGKKICSWCVANWKEKEKKAGRRLLFIEYRGETADLAELRRQAREKEENEQAKIK